MTRERKRNAAIRRIGWGTICAAIILVELLVWVHLPEIAGFGLRFDATWRVSQKTLVWLGPRAVSEVLEHHKRFGEGDWFDHVRNTLREADADERKTRTLVRSAGDINAQYTEARWTLLHFACHDCCGDLAEALINGGADVNVKDRDGDTPLHVASCGAYVDDVGVVAMLLAHGADVAITNEEGKTALDLAHADARDDIAEMLRKHIEEQ